MFFEFLEEVVHAFDLNVALVHACSAFHGIVGFLAFAHLLQLETGDVEHLVAEVEFVFVIVVIFLLLVVIVLCYQQAGIGELHVEPSGVVGDQHNLLLLIETQSGQAQVALAGLVLGLY